ncbi:MAG: prephenate dehydratase domain-containing protein, partial [Candidatus Bathyarchaeota archaeon]
MGPRGTFCEQAAIKYFSGKKVKLVDFPTIPDVFKAVDSNQVKYGIVPVENSTEGFVNITLDFLYRTDLRICGEIEERICHNLIVRPGSRLSKTRSIISHPRALAQCRRFIEKKFPKTKIYKTNSTAYAVKSLKKFKHAAAIGTISAAKNYGMKVVLKNIEDTPINFTRFLVVCHSDFTLTGNDKTSIVFAT